KHALSLNVYVSKWEEWRNGHGTPQWLIIDKDKDKDITYIIKKINKGRIDIYLVENPFIPMDEADQNPDFKKFRDELINAIKKKDLKFLLQHTDDKISYSFGGCDEDTIIKGFIKFWKLDENPEKSEIWYELGEVLRLGGAFNDEKTSFTAPISSARWPGILDAYEGSVIIGENVNVRSEPSSKSKVITRLSYCVVRGGKSENETGSETINGETYPWIAISTSGFDVYGYVFGKYIRSPIDYRACFEKKNGVWKMVFFIAGD
ncbi:MAG: hypothetical protein QG641_2665, partial [Candidatus Poribacteria bacterium]|nr:hypothetical protein [Candidatus Poribacteria bacterium]